MTERAQAGPQRILCVSIPRAGHHYLASLIRAVLGDDCHYCEYYTPVDCCRAIPCTRGETARVVLQKNHDFDLQVPTDLPGVTYVIQYRNPVMAVLSDREYLARLEGRSRADDVAEYEVWLGKRGAHFKRFWDKWLARRNDRHIVIEYSELQRNPSAALEQVLRGVGVAIDAHRVEAAVRDVSGIVADFPVHSPAMPYSPRVMKDSQYFDPALMSVYESMLLETIPGLESTGLLQRTGPVDHPTRLVYQAALSTAAGAPDEAVAALKKAAQIAPHNPYVWEDLSLASLQVNDQEQAIAAASEALKLRPRNTILLRLVSDLYSLRAKADLDRAVTVARTLLELSPVDPGHLVHLASLLVRRREYVEAGGLAAQAMSNNPGDAFVWRECSEVLAITGDRAGALDAMKEALIRLPTNAEFHHHLGNLLVEGGDLAGAINAHARALELAPTEVGWRCALGEELASIGQLEEARALLDQGPHDQPDSRQLVQLRERLARGELTAVGQDVSAVPYDPQSRPTREDVFDAYRLLLGRKPEDERAIAGHLTAPDRRALVRGFLESQEFSSYMPAAEPAQNRAPSKPDE